MPATMHAFVMERIGHVAFAEMPRANDPGPDGAIVKTTKALICTSDTHTARGTKQDGIIKPLIAFD